MPSARRFSSGRAPVKAVCASPCFFARGRPAQLVCVPAWCTHQVRQASVGTLEPRKTQNMAAQRRQTPTHVIVHPHTNNTVCRGMRAGRHQDTTQNNTVSRGPPLRLCLACSVRRHASGSSRAAGCKYRREPSSSIYVNPVPPQPFWLIIGPDRSNRHRCHSGCESSHAGRRSR